MLGINDKTVLTGNEYIHMTGPKCDDISCLDCFERLIEEIEEIEND